MTDTNQIPERHPRAVQLRVGEALAAGSVEITPVVESTYKEVIALGLTGVSVDTAAQIVLAAQVKRLVGLLTDCVDGQHSINTNPRHD